MLRASPHLSHFVPLPPRSRKRTGRKKRDVCKPDCTSRAQTCNRNVKVWTGWRREKRRWGRSVMVREFRKRKGWQHEERCCINTRPYTGETRCYSRYARRPRTIAVIRERERIQAEDRRSAGQAVETRGKKDKELRRRRRKVLHQDGTR